ncbi:D-alanyl-D-alanine carboxypeptidase [Candidatus Kaiserbacteria bacterium]|nr:D-alanyl-D-alanine carboxypeptidase [Candidatus Kaiserbacteria bacterium]
MEPQQQVPEIPQTPILPPETSAPVQQPHWALAIPRLWGFATLVFVFAGSAIFTATFLSSAAPDPRPAYAAVAAAEIIPPPPTAFDEVEISARSAYVMDISSGGVMYSKEPDLQWPLASLTKVPLALAVAEVLAPDDVIIIPYDTNPIGSPKRLAKNSRWRAQDIIDLTLAASSNEGAAILAAAADERLRERYPQAPHGEAAVWRMNHITRQLKLPHSYFLNPTGLDESTTQSGSYGTARDMAYLFAYAASSSPDTFLATTRKSVTISSLDDETASAQNTDEALDAIPGIILGKTGYTELAGGNLAIVFRTATGHHIVAVVLGSTQQGRFADMKTLVRAAEQATKDLESVGAFSHSAQ